MKDWSYIFRTNWLAVPDFLYFILLFGGWILLLASTGMTIYGRIQKKNNAFFSRWIIVFVVSFVMVLLTMTGKIAPYMAYGG